MRLFIALPLPESARTTLEALQARFPTGRAVPFDNLHLTLTFLGEQTEEAAEAVHEGLQTLRSPAQHLTLAGGTVFGGRHGQAIALEANGGADLTTLHDRVLSRLRGAGIAPERRRFRPHVTLARMGGRENAGPVLAVLASASVGPFVCDAVSLYASTLHPDGAIHEELARYPLALLI
ncbi:RNA 2',3'-cyclic phosphodiesterase [Antarctobacter sp.]|uniref:RNA 2',3'-cyclic phosphodiesterase n=1 Tax=Antarctobacter sp. TaxID=1872577 RepID=UPI002B26B81A|nr:RNA 2',3'-cyclic phosphodiesterase [Antarctobacter sp.]